MTTRRWTAAIALVAALAGPAAAQEAEPVSPAGPIAVTEADDGAIRDRIADILAGIDGYAGVSVVVDGGVVTLTGEALDAAAVGRLNRLVSRVDGVVEIENAVRETTDVSTRLGSIRDRLLARLDQTVALLPLLAVGLLAAAAILAAARWLARWRGLWDRVAPNPFIAEILAQAVRLGGIIVAIVALLDIIGAGALLGTVLGAAGIIGIALGFAVRDTVENFIASVLLSLRQPFRPNDLVDIDGRLGRVIRLTSRSTTLLSLDGNDIRIPNGAVFKAVITNFTRNPERRFVFDLGVDADSDLAAVRALGLETLRNLDFVLESPAPVVWVDQVGDSNVVLRFTGWVTQQGAEFSLARGEAIRIVKEALEAGGYGLPEPIYRVRMSELSETAVPPPAPPPAAPRSPPAAPPPPPDLRPDTALDRLVAKGRDAGEANLLSAHAPQE